MTALLLFAAVIAPVEVVYHADLEGQMAVPSCGKPVIEPPDFAALVGTISRLRADAAAKNASPPIVLLGGDEIAPDLFVRGILKRDGDAGAKDIGAVLKRADYDAISVGNHELDTDRDRFERFAQVVTGLGMPLVITNLKCDSAKQKICHYLVPEVVVERGGQRIGIIATLSPSTLPTIPAKNLAGLALDPPLQSIRAAMKRLRERGVTTVLVMTQIKNDLAGMNEMQELRHQLAGPDGPDVILSSGMGGAAGESVLRLSFEDGAPPMVGSSVGTRSVSDVFIKPPVPGSRQRNEVTVNDQLADTAHSDAETATILAPHIKTYCERYGHSVGPGRITGSLTRDQFLTYLLEAMRKKMGTEIAIINKNFVREKVFPLSGELTVAELYRAIPGHAVLGTARINGGAMSAFTTTALADTKIAQVGIEAGPKVNGRTLDGSRAYTVATIDFVAEGADGIFSSGDIPFRPAKGSPDLREFFQNFLETSTALEDRDPSINLATDFGAPPGERLLVVGLSDFSADFSKTSIMNAGNIYKDTQLNGSQQMSLLLAYSGLVYLRHPKHEMDNRLDLKYGFATVEAPNEPAATSTTADLIAFTTLYNYRGFRKNPAAASYIPDPYARVYFESEFVLPAPIPPSTTPPRNWHHALLTPTVGAVITLINKLKLRAGAGATKELAANPDSSNPEEATVGRVRFVVEAGATLDPIALFTLGGLSTTLEGFLNYSIIDPAGAFEHEIQGTMKLAVPLLPLLYITATADLYAVKDYRAPWGVEWDTTAGLRVHLDTAHQSQ